MKKIFSAVMSAVLAFNMTVAVKAADFNSDEFIAKCDELDFLIRKCETRGINVDAERVSATTIRRFIKEVEFDALLDENLKAEGTSLTEKTNRSVNYQINALNSIYEDTKTELESYLDGTEVSKSVASPYTSGVITVNEDGMYVDKEPFYSLGYGHFHTVQNDIPIMKDLGAEHISCYIRPENVVEVLSAGNNTYTNSGAGRDATVEKLQNRLSDAEEEGVGINLLLSADNAPSWFLRWYPELNTTGGLFRFDTTYRQVISSYFEGVLPAIKDYNSLESIILTNEPSLITYQYPDYFKTDFSKYLLAKHGKISDLNEAWGTEYKRWSDIGMPQYDINTGLPLVYDALYYDWYIYNEEKMAEWHGWLASEVRKHIPDAKISIKTLNYIWHDDNTQRMYGICGNDLERYAEFCDYAGLDAHGNISDYKQIVSKYLYYDFARSVTRQPVFNSEDHMFYDSYKKFGDRETIQDEHVSASIWQGAIHGCEKTSLWVWERLNYTPVTGETWTSALDRELSSIYNATFLHRPEAVVAAGNQAVNLRRLNDEVRAVENSKDTMAILYSKSARVYNLDYVKTMNEAYETMIATGFGVDFVTELKPERMHGYDTVILTGANNLETETLKELCTFSENGGTIILMDSSIEKNEYNQQGNSEYISAITNSENTILTANDTAEFYLALKNADTRDVKVELKNAENEYVKGIDFKWTENDDGSILINICNLSNADIKGLTLYINGEAITTKDLIEGKIIEPEFTAKRYEPILIYIPGNGSLVKNMAVCSDDEGNKTISWDRGLFPAYVYNIDNGIENKRLVGVKEDDFKAKKEGIYYICMSDSNTVYPGRIISLKNDTVFEISKTESGFEVVNISDKYAAGILELKYENINPAASTFINLFMEPGEQKNILAEGEASVMVYNNLYQMEKISN